jgi:hypothetical protein
MPRFGEERFMDKLVFLPFVFVPGLEKPLEQDTQVCIDLFTPLITPPVERRANRFHLFDKLQMLVVTALGTFGQSRIKLAEVLEQMAALLAIELLRNDLEQRGHDHFQMSPHRRNLQHQLAQLFHQMDEPRVIFLEAGTDLITLWRSDHEMFLSLHRR